MSLEIKYSYWCDAPSCNGDGTEVQGSAKLPKWWHKCIVKGIVKYACSKGCLEEIKGTLKKCANQVNGSACSCLEISEPSRWCYFCKKQHNEQKKKGCWCKWCDTRSEYDKNHEDNPCTS